MPPAILDHIEKTFADHYRKEIDQEENIWRSLPFFAATLALQLAALAQFQAQILRLTGWWSWAVEGLLGAVALVSLGALLLLVRSIWWSRFTYITDETALLAYAKALEDAERGTRTTSEDAVTTLKRELARQYAAATVENRAINQARLRTRTTAGIATLASVVLTLTCCWHPPSPALISLGMDAATGVAAMQAKPPAEAETPPRPAPTPSEVPRPPMRVVEKGFKFGRLREWTVPVEEVERWNRERKR